MYKPSGPAPCLIFSAFSEPLAKKIGDNDETEALLKMDWKAQNTKNAKVIDGHRFFFCSQRNLVKCLFPRWSHAKVARVLCRLTEKHLLLTDPKLNTWKKDRTISYAVNQEEWIKLGVDQDVARKNAASPCGDSASPCDKNASPCGDNTEESKRTKIKRTLNPFLQKGQQDLSFSSSDEDENTDSEQVARQEQANVNHRHASGQDSEDIQAVSPDFVASNPPSAERGGMQKVSAILSALKISQAGAFSPAAGHDLDDRHPQPIVSSKKLDEHFESDDQTDPTVRAKGTSSRANGTNPRATGDNPRALGTNPKAVGTVPEKVRGRNYPELLQENAVLQEKIERFQREEAARQKRYEEQEVRRKQDEQDESDKLLNCLNCGGAGEIHGFTKDGQSLGLVKCPHQNLRIMRPDGKTKGLMDYVNEGIAAAKRRRREYESAKLFEQEQASRVHVSPFRPQGTQESAPRSEGFNSP